MKRNKVIRAIALLLFAAILTAGLPAGARAEIETVAPVKIDKMRTLNVLFIGNSYSEDTSRYLYDIADQTGYRICVGDAWLGGLRLSDHVENALADNPAYTYFENTEGEWNQIYDGDSETWSLSRVLISRRWDVILLQSKSVDVGLLSSFYPDGDESKPCLLEELAQYCKVYCPWAHIAYNMTWADREGSESEGFEEYGTQMRMCEAAWSVTQSILDTRREMNELTSDDPVADSKEAASGLSEGISRLAGTIPSRAPTVEFVVPVGTAIQNARSSYMGDTLTRDYKHLNYGIGRYIASMTVAASLGYPVESITSMDLYDTASSLHLPVIKASVRAAVENPFALSVQTQERPVLPCMNVTVKGEGNRVDLSWESVAGATSYVVSYQDSGSEESISVTLPSSDTSYDFQGEEGPVFISVCAMGDAYISKSAPYETSMYLR